MIKAITPTETYYADPYTNTLYNSAGREINDTRLLTDYSIYAFQKYNCSRKRKRTACILLTEIKMRLTEYNLYVVFCNRQKGKRGL